MGKFLEAEKQRLSVWKQTTPYLSEGARAPGTYRGRLRDFCLPKAYAEENLYEEIRLSALGYFAAHDIKWHHGQNSKCSNHLCDSMVSCVNFLFPFTDKPDALAGLLRPLFPSLKQILPMERSGLGVAFEWIGLENYLGELVRGNRDRTRGALFTSADAAVRFEDDTGRTQIALIEWKYTESYGRSSKAHGRSGERRQAIYRPHFEAPDSPVDLARVPDYLDFFFEPFYQMMRQQFLAHEMERAHELEAQAVTVVHVAPKQNRDLEGITSPGLESLGNTATGVWKALLRKPERFITVHTEDLLAAVDTGAFPDLAGWYDYMKERYPF